MRGAVYGAVNPNPWQTLLRVDRSLEVEAHESGSLFRPASAHAVTAWGQCLLMRKGRCAGREAPERERTLHVVCGMK
jgi:hypothetical protein